MTQKLHPSQRIICVSNSFIHSDLSEFGNLELSITLWNHDTEIPEDWHTTDNLMELNLEFTVQSLIQDMLFTYESEYDNEGGIVISSHYKKIVEKFKEDFQEALNTLNKINFYDYDNQDFLE